MCFGRVTLTTGDQLWVDQDSRAELHIGSAGLRLASGTAFQLLNLDDRTAQIQITQGSLNIHLRFLDENQSFEVDTPSMAFTLLRPGEYRIDANPDNQTTMAVVRGGEGEVTGGGRAFTLNSGFRLLSISTARCPCSLASVEPRRLAKSWIKPGFQTCRSRKSEGI